MVTLSKINVRKLLEVLCKEGKVDKESCRKWPEFFDPGCCVHASLSVLTNILIDTFHEASPEEKLVPDIISDLVYSDGESTHVFSFDDETALGEPQMWIYLKDGTSLEVTHEENGLSPKDQYFSCRLHCSEEDFDNDVYHSTMGVIDQTSGGLGTVCRMIEAEIKRRGLSPEGEEA